MNSLFVATKQASHPSTTHTGVSAEWATQVTLQRTKRRGSSGAAQQRGEHGWTAPSLHPNDLVPPTDFPRASRILQDLLSFNDCIAAGLAKMTRSCLSLHCCCSQQSSALQMKELSPAQGSTAGFPHHVEQNSCPLARAEL